MPAAAEPGAPSVFPSACMNEFRMILRTLSVFFVGKNISRYFEGPTPPTLTRRQGSGLWLGGTCGADARWSWLVVAQVSEPGFSASSWREPSQRLVAPTSQATQPLGGVVGGEVGAVGSPLGTPGVPGVPGSVGVGVGAGLVLPAIGTAAAARFIGLLLGSVPVQWALTKAVMASTMSHWVSGESRRRLPCWQGGEFGVPRYTGTPYTSMCAG